MGKKLLKTVLIILAAVVVLAAGFVIFLTVTEYKPEAVESVPILSY